LTRNAGDATTVRGSARVEEAGPAERVLALTLLWHPDLTRVGEVALLEPGARLSRLEPELGRGPLGDPHISRKPMRIEERRDGAVVLVPPDGGCDARVGGEPLSARRALTAGEVERGVIIELADRAALLLHRRTPIASRPPTLGLLGDSDAILATRAEILRVADLDAPVLLRGETGTGKELCARAIHDASRRAGGPFVAINLAAIPAAMAGSQLFGHTRGAFTGAGADHDGVFARADGGTLFLDEIGEVPAEVQPVLLRALDSGELWPIGAAQSRQVSVRLVTATDADVEARAVEGSFRAPLLHRLAGYVLRLPPLRERRDDIARLLVHFLGQELAAAGEPDHLAGEEPWLRASVVAALCRHGWPGNVRELRNAARRLVIDSRGARRAQPDKLLAELKTPPARAPASARGSLSAQRVLAELERCEWKPGATAVALGISKTTLYALMQKLGCRKARDLSAEEIGESARVSGGDLERMAATLRVSRRGLRLRMRELEIDLGR
jgi:two-component system nitrogen regulation response regulator GlnG